MFIHLIADDIIPGCIELRRPIVLSMHDTVFFFKEETIYFQTLLYLRKFDLQYVSQEIK